MKDNTKAETGTLIDLAKPHFTCRHACINDQEFEKKHTFRGQCGGTYCTRK